MTDEYFLWNAPHDGLPEYTSGGFGVTVLPGFGQWVLLNGSVRDIPPDAIPVSAIVGVLEGISAALKAASARALSDKDVVGDR